MRHEYIENPWYFEGEVFTEENIEKYYGFVYLITNLLSGKMYIGRKYFTAKRGKKRIQSDWKKYYGSSKTLTEDVTNIGYKNFSREILSLHFTRGDTNYWETKVQFELNVLEEKNENGERLYYNNNIMSRYFAPKKEFSPEHRRKLSESRIGISFTREHKENISRSKKGGNTWNKGVLGSTKGNTKKRSEEERKKISQSLKEKNIQPKYCKNNKTEAHRKKISQSLKETGNFATKNPNSPDNWEADILTKDGLTTIESPSVWCSLNNINYNALKAWSKKNLDNERLHSKYNIKIIAFRKKGIEH